MEQAGKRVENTHSKTQEGVDGSGRGKDGVRSGLEMEVQKPYSFRDKVLGGSRVPSKRVSSGLLQMKLASLDWESGDRLAPHVVFDETVLQAFAAPWKELR